MQSFVHQAFCDVYEVVSFMYQYCFVRISDQQMQTGRHKPSNNLAGCIFLHAGMVP